MIIVKAIVYLCFASMAGAMFIVLPLALLVSDPLDVLLNGTREDRERHQMFRMLIMGMIFVPFAVLTVVALLGGFVCCGR